MIPTDSVYCQPHDMYRPCAWCTDRQNRESMADRGSASVARVIVAAAASVLALLAFSAVAPVELVPASIPAPTTLAPVAPVAEDDPRWDCWTMGNGYCGPVAIVIGADGTADVHDAPPATATDDTLAYGSVPIGSGSLPDACTGGTGTGPGRNGPIAYVLPIGNGRAAVVHHGTGGACVAAVGPMS